jgi:membrane-associated PAP2 superfamily phosphatase
VWTALICWYVSLLLYWLAFARHRTTTPVISAVVA